MGAYGHRDDAAFGFGDDLVFDDQDIARLKVNTATAEGFEQFVGEGIAGQSFVREGDWDQVKFGSRIDFLWPLRGSRISRR